MCHGSSSLLRATPLLAALLLVAPGCGNNPATVDDATLAERRRQLGEKLKVTRTVLKDQGHDGVVRGRVVYDGEPPPQQFLRDVHVHPEKNICLRGGRAGLPDETWVVHPDNKGVANVVLYLDPPPATYFDLSAAETKRSGEVVVIDQPHCTFVPHVVAHFPAYYDGSKNVPTGQVLEVRNSDTVKHSLQCNDTKENDRILFDLAPGGKKALSLNPQRGPLEYACGLHKWMRGIVFLFAHPYYAVTGPDGSFEIRNIPTGVELTLNAWHEGRREVFEQRKMTVQKGDNPPLELTLKEVKTRK